MDNEMVRYEMVRYEDVLSAPQMCHVVGCTYRQLDYWCRSGVVAPAIDAVGSGSKRLFARSQVRVVLAVFLLRETGVGSRGACRSHEIDRDTARKFAVATGSWEGLVVEVSRHGPVAVSLDLGWVEEEAEARMAEYGRDRVIVDVTAPAGLGRVVMADARRAFAVDARGRQEERTASLMETAGRMAALRR